MHIELISEPIEDPDSPEPEPKNNTHLDHNGTYFIVECEVGSVSVSLLDIRWIDSFHTIKMTDIQSIIEKTIGSKPHPRSFPDGLITFAIVASDDAHMYQLNNDFRNNLIEFCHELNFITGQSIKHVSGSTSISTTAKKSIEHK